MGEAAFADDAGDFQPERDAIAAAGLCADSSDYSPDLDDIPNSISRPDLNGVADSFRICERSPTLIDADTFISDPTQRDTAYLNGPPPRRNLHISGIFRNCAAIYSGRRGRGIRRSLNHLLRGRARYSAAMTASSWPHTQGLHRATLGAAQRRWEVSSRQWGVRFTPCSRRPPEITTCAIRKVQISNYGRDQHGGGASIFGYEHPSGGSKCQRTALREPRSHPLWGLRPTTANREKGPNRADLGGEISCCWKLRNAGRGISHSFRECAEIRVIYRQCAPCTFKESTRRLRDFAITLEDYDLWQSRDIAPDKCPEELQARAENSIWSREDARPPARWAAGN